MKIKVLNPSNGNVVSENPQGISFGNVRAGEHCDAPVLIKPFRTLENNFLEMKLFLQNNGGLGNTQFGYYTNSQFATGVDYTNALSDHFSVATGVTGINYNEVSGVPISLEGGDPSDFIWLDMQPGPYEVGPTSTINYRFVFDYN